MSDLIERLEYRIASCGKRNRRNYYASFAILFCSVIASAATTVAVSVDQMPRPAIAALASLSGILILVNTTFRFEERSRWYWRKRTMLEVLCRRYRYEGMSESDISQKWNQIDEEMFLEWPGFEASNPIVTPKIERKTEQS